MKHGCFWILILLGFFAFPKEASAEGIITYSTKKLGECKTAPDLPICILKYYISKSEPNYFIPPEIENNEEIMASLKLKISDKNKGIEQFTDDFEMKDLIKSKELITKAIIDDNKGISPIISLAALKNYAKGLKTKPLPYIGYGLPNGHEIRAMAYENIVSLYFNKNSKIRPSLALTKAAMLEWENEHLSIKDNYLHYWVRWTDLVDRYFELNDNAAIERMSKTLPKTKGYIQYKKFANAIKNNEFEEISKTALLEYQGIRDLEEDTYEYNFNKLKPEAMKLLAQNGHKIQAIEIGKHLLSEKYRLGFGENAIISLSGLMNKDEFLQILKPFDDVALNSKFANQPKLNLDEAYSYNSTIGKEINFQDIIISMIGHQAINDKNLNEIILKNWQLIGSPPPKNLYRMDFTPNDSYYGTYHKMLLIADKPIEAIENYQMQPLTAIIWDLTHGNGFNNIDKYSKYPNFAQEIEIASAECASIHYDNKNFSNGADCVRQHAKYSLNRQFTEHELSFINDIVHNAPPYNTSAAGLIIISAIQAGEYAKIGDMKTADEMIDLMFVAIDKSPDHECNIFIDSFLKDYAIAKLKQQTILKAN